MKKQDKEFVKKTLEFIKERSNFVQYLYKLKIDIINLDLGENLMIEAIARIVVSHKKDKNKKWKGKTKIQIIKEDIEWWLYENVDKIIYFDMDDKLDINDIDDYIDYLFSDEC